MAMRQPGRSDFFSQLSALVGEGDLLTEPEDLIPYGFDGPASMKQSATFVVTPRCSETFAAILKLAAEEGFPIVTRGSVTGLSGGSIPLEGGILRCPC